LLGSDGLGLTAEIDILEAEDGAATPVDIKAGKRPHVAEGVFARAGAGLRAGASAARGGLPVR
jgi:hypothetical protein